MKRPVYTSLALLTGALTVLAVPSTPTLIFPATNAVNIGSSPPLMVRVSEPASGKLTVRYFGRLALSPGPDFTIVAMPDTQCYTGQLNGGKKEMMIAQTEWAIANRESRNVVYVAELGDISNNGDTPSYVSQWYNATNAMYRLENPTATQLADGMPYGVAVGNHEQTPNSNADSGTTTNYNKYFGVSHFQGRSYYAGHYGTNNNNHFDFFSANGLDFVVIHFEYDATMNAPVLTWANEILRTNANRRAILVTHYFGSASTPSTFSTQGAAIYNALKTNANLFLMLSGHVCGEGSREDTFNGHTVHTLVSDYQCYPNGGNGFMRLMEFSPSNNVVVVQTYSPWTGEYETDEDSEFFFPHTMPPSMPSSAAFTELHTESGVSSGDVASFSWSGLLPYRTYEWYVTVTDSSNNTVVSPTWRFTTAMSYPRHDVAAATLKVSQIPGFSGADEDTNCAVTQTFSVNDLRAGTFNRADYNVQTGPNPALNWAQGVLISSVAENGRNNYGTNLYATSAVETNADGSYRIVTYSSPNTDGATGSGFGYEYNMNVAGAWFPYSTWLGGFVRNAAGIDGGFWNAFTGSPGLALGTHIKSMTNGYAVVDLTSLGIDSRTDGVLLVNCARDEGNFALSQVNSNNGTWNVFLKDNSAYTANAYEQDPLAFVFVPRTNTAVVSGRFLANGTIDMYSGESPVFTVEPLGTGRWQLKINGRSPAEGTLIISAEGGNTYNLDNIVSYQVNTNGDGWEIQSRDTPKNALQTPGTSEPVVSFVYVPSLPPGIAVTPTENLATVENGTTATFNVMLDTQPSANVEMTLASTDTSEGTVFPNSLTFTTNNWHDPQTVTITGVDDLVLDGNIPYQVTFTVNSTDTNYGTMQPGPVSVVNLDNEPQLFVRSGEVAYGIGMPGIALDGQARLVDPATPNYNGCTLTVTLTTNATANDRLEIRNVGTGAGQVSVYENNVRYGSTVIGNVTGGIGATPLVVTFYSTATPAAVQAVLQAITFRNVSDNPSLGQRTVDIVLVKTDGITASAKTSVRVALMRVSQFQQGVDNGYGVYTDTADCQLSPLSPTTPLPSGQNGDNVIWMDAPATNVVEGGEALLRFANIAGTAPGQIPTNATIVSAELILTIPPDISNTPGDGSPLYRMLVAWNPKTVTYNNAGSGNEGFVPDGIYARSNYDSFLGLSNGDGTTGTGTISLGVTADVEAWVNGGEPNYGWLMPGWQPPASTTPQTDGTGFAGGKWTLDVTQRPLLKVCWLPKDTAVASFRQGVNGYTGAQDTRIRATTPTTTFATVTVLYSDWGVSGSSDNEHVLLRFDGIIGTNAGQVPPGSRIEAAMLDLSSSVGNGMGDGGQFFAILQPWQDATSTWDSWVNGIQTNGIEAATTPTAVAGNANRTPDVQAAYNSFDLAPDVQAWTYGSRTNYGWVILPWPSGTDGWGIASSESTAQNDRPRLRVFYTTPGTGDISLLAPVRTTGQVQIGFSGIVGTACSVQRASTLGGPWTTLGSVVVGQNGIGTFTDPSPLPSAAFYRVKFP